MYTLSFLRPLNKLISNFNYIKRNLDPKCKIYLTTNYIDERTFFLVKTINLKSGRILNNIFDYNNWTPAYLKRFVDTNHGIISIELMYKN